MRPADSSSLARALQDAIRKQLCPPMEISPPMLRLAWQSTPLMAYRQARQVPARCSEGNAEKAPNEGLGTSSYIGCGRQLRAVGFGVRGYTPVHALRAGSSPASCTHWSSLIQQKLITSEMQSGRAIAPCDSLHSSCHCRGKFTDSCCTCLESEGSQPTVYSSSRHSASLQGISCLRIS